ncbi:hypothetical protein [Sediminibacterium sp.]|uniref:hypothetical protein n=1 Tax=Sediminibacterium sp. TaxID=1917865 RepID=UPI003F69FBAE
MTKEERLNHALNNEAASKVLLSSGKFDDWVITTTFYASLHYICYHLFPMTAEKNGRTVTIRTIDQYRSHYKIEKNRHRTLCDLAFAVSHDLGAEYNYLLDQSMLARYHHYKFEESVVTSCKASLIVIKQILNIPMS